MQRARTTRSRDRGVRVLPERARYGSSTSSRSSSRSNRRRREAPQSSSSRLGDGGGGDFLDSEETMKTPNWCGSAVLWQSFVSIEVQVDGIVKTKLRGKSSAILAVDKEAVYAGGHNWRIKHRELDPAPIHDFLRNVGEEEGSKSYMLILSTLGDGSVSNKSFTCTFSARSSPLLESAMKFFRKLLRIHHRWKKKHLPEDFEEDDHEDDERGHRHTERRILPSSRQKSQSANLNIGTLGLLQSPASGPSRRAAAAAAAAVASPALLKSPNRAMKATDSYLSSSRPSPRRVYGRSSNKPPSSPPILGSIVVATSPSSLNPENANTSPPQHIHDPDTSSLSLPDDHHQPHRNSLDTISTGPRSSQPFDLHHDHDHHQPSTPKPGMPSKRQDQPPLDETPFHRVGQRLKKKRRTQPDADSDVEFDDSSTSSQRTKSKQNIEPFSVSPSRATSPQKYPQEKSPPITPEMTTHPTDEINGPNRTVSVSDEEDSTKRPTHQTKLSSNHCPPKQKITSFFTAETKTLHHTTAIAQTAKKTQTDLAASSPSFNSTSSPPSLVESKAGSKPATDNSIASVPSLEATHEPPPLFEDDFRSKSPERTKPAPLLHEIDAPHGTYSPPNSLHKTKRNRDPDNAGYEKSLCSPFCADDDLPDLPSSLTVQHSPKKYSNVKRPQSSAFSQQTPSAKRTLDLDKCPNSPSPPKHSSSPSDREIVPYENPYSKRTKFQTTSATTSYVNDNYAYGYGRSGNFPRGLSYRRDNTLFATDHNVAVGLRNLGNTCYLNSSLQMLFGVRGFLSSLSKFYFSHNADCKNERRQLTPALLHIADALGVGVPRLGREDARSITAHNNVVDPSAVKEVMDTLTDKFVGYEQRDAHEFLSDLLDLLHDELALLSSPVDTAGVGSDVCTSKTRTLPTDEYFRLDVRVCLTCDSCGYSRAKEEMYRHLSIDVRSGAQKDDGSSESRWSVDMGLEKFFSPEKREIKCEKCSAGRSATQTMEILRRPKALLLHLKRFILTMSNASGSKPGVGENEKESVLNSDKDSPSKTADRNDYQQERTRVSFRKNRACVRLHRTLSVDPFCASTEKQETNDTLTGRRYKIRSVVRHLGGTAFSGHYTTDAARDQLSLLARGRNERNAVVDTDQGKYGEETWVRFDDRRTKFSSLSDVTANDACQRSAYMVLYELE